MLCGENVRENAADASLDRVYTVKLNDVTLNNISYTKDDTEYIPYTIRIDDEEAAVIKNRALEQLHLRNIDPSEVKMTDTLHGKVHGNVIIRSPKAENNMLHTERMKISDSVGEGDAAYARGVFDLAVIVTLTCSTNTGEEVSCFIYKVSVEDDQIRYMGDCVFPDYFTNIGEQSVPIEVVSKFMKEY